MKTLILTTTLMLLTSCAHTVQDGSSSDNRTSKQQSYDYWVRYHSNTDRR